MQLLIKANLEGELILPLSYHHILQGIIYNLMEMEYGVGEELHEGGARYEKRTFKLFTFSLLQGEYRVRNGKIVFSDWLALEIRSADPMFIRMLEEAVISHGMTFRSGTVYPVYTELRDDSISDGCIDVCMRSPVTVHKTDRVTGKKRYYTPLDDEFSELVDGNFRRKYEACTGRPPEKGIQIEALAVGSRDKYVTRFKNDAGKNALIFAWNGYYRLRGTPEALTFLYNTGIGSNNSQGFGMFELIEEAHR